MKRLFWLACLLPGICFSQVVKPRKYRKGEHFRYQLTTESYRNGQFVAKTISISDHKVIKDSGRLVERIYWTNKASMSGADTLVLDSLAQQVRPYLLSLLPGGPLRMPPLLIPEMTGDITDLHTFYVAISPALHVQRLGPNNLLFRDSVLKGNFADGRDIITGDDCMEVIQKLLVRDKLINVVQTLFVPPGFTCITPLLDTIGIPLFEVPNNFQMVRKGPGEKVTLMWGVEEFTITSTLDARSSQLLYAEMTNQLRLRVRSGASPDLAAYDTEIPITITRVLKLELLKK